MATFVIAEKPSVAGDIARALGGFKKSGEYWISDDMVIGSAVGHLLEIKAPEAYDVKRGRWSFANLPVIPPYFELQPIAKNEAKFVSLAKKLRSRTITDVVNACDAGREGELIFRYIMQASGSKKPVRRLWLQSMTKAGIRSAFEQLRSDEEMKPLETAARCRSEADWLVGINGTRAMTAFNSKDGGFFLTTVGRVQTPTLAIVVAREEEIKRFNPKRYWNVRASFATAEGVYEGVWFDPSFVKPKTPSDLRAERLWTEDEARRLVEKCRDCDGIVSDVQKKSTQMSPALFDLTSLQREANARFGFPAKMTLAIAQRLYERHKVLTYPRTDSRALPEDYIDTVRETLGKLSSIVAYSRYTNEVLANGWVHPDKRVFDNTKISDHFAIIPTGEIPKSLDETDQKIYDLVVRRFISVFYPAAEFNVTTRITKVEGEHFLTEGKVLVKAGWLEPAGRAQKSSDLVPVAADERVCAKSVEVLSDETRPPARYTDATLLSAMENAGKKLDSGELRDAMAEKGLGTPATRAQTIEGLIDQRYLRRDQRELVPTPKAFQLIALVRGLQIDVLTQPRLTAEWEKKLAMIETGDETGENFMSDIRLLTENIVARAKQYEGDSVPIENPMHCKNRCPACGGEVVEGYRRFSCTTPGCYFSFSKHPSGRVFAPEEVEELLATHHVGPLSGFMSKRGFPFEGELVLERNVEDGHWGMRFDFEERPEPDAEELLQAPVIGTCPKCGAPVHETADAYICETAFRTPKKCPMRLGKTILQRDITVGEAVALLENKTTPLLEGFVSKRTGRPFRSYLVFDAKKGVVFKFEERKAKETVDGSEDTSADVSEIVSTEAAEKPERTFHHRTIMKSES